jgi:hypothetical protein
MFVRPYQRQADRGETTGARVLPGLPLLEDENPVKVTEPPLEVCDHGGAPGPSPG